jgi:hypothetical protein
MKRVMPPEMTREALYVASTRGRTATHWSTVTDHLLDPTTDHEPDPPDTAVEVITAVLARTGAEDSATHTLRATDLETPSPAHHRPRPPPRNAHQGLPRAVPPDTPHRRRPRTTTRPRRSAVRLRHRPPSEAGQHDTPAQGHDPRNAWNGRAGGANQQMPGTQPVTRLLNALVATTETIESTA